MSATARIVCTAIIVGAAGAAMIQMGIPFGAAAGVTIVMGVILVLL